MKKLVSIALIALFTIGAFAQDGRKKQRKQEFTVDQIATLKTKKMTLLLDLNSQQQQEILEINKQKVTEHKEKKAARKALKESDTKPTSEAIFNMKNDQLDNMIAHKADMKKVLTTEQFETWLQARKKKGKRLKKRSAQRKGQQRRVKR